MMWCILKAIGSAPNPVLIQHPVVVLARNTMQGLSSHLKMVRPLSQHSLQTQYPCLVLSDTHAASETMLQISYLYCYGAPIRISFEQIIHEFWVISVSTWTEKAHTSFEKEIRTCINLFVIYFKDIQRSGNRSLRILLGVTLIVEKVQKMKELIIVNLNKMYRKLICSGSYQQCYIITEKWYRLRRN